MSPHPRWQGSLLASCLVLTVLSASSLAADDPRVPTREVPEPAYPHKSFRAQLFGAGPMSYWLFEPAEPTPATAPVVVFNHGWLAVNPGIYGAWIEHLTRCGRVVIFPRYQADWTTPPDEFLPNALTAVRDALDVLETGPDRVRPDRSRFALIGHSAGGNLAALMAAAALSSGLPSPRAVLCVMPGEVVHIDEPSLADIPADTLLMVIAGDQDRVVGDYRARQIFVEATSVPPSRKEFVLYRTDRRGPVPVVADHLAPTCALPRLDSGEGPLRTFQFSRAGVDLLDRYGFWRLADLTLHAAFQGQTLDEATRKGSLIRDLGRWSDGLVVSPPVAGDDLATIPRVFPSNGARLIPWQPRDFFRILMPETTDEAP